MSSVSSVNSGYSMSGMQGMHHAHQKPSASQLADNLFSQLDTTNQGYIEQSQFAAAFSSSNQANAEKVFAAMDTDSNGQVTKTELTASLEERMQSASAQFQTRMGMQQGGHETGNMSPLSDKGGMRTGQNDKGLTQDELTAKASEESNSKMSSLFATIANNFSAADSDGDGKVTAKEAHAYEKSQQQTSTTASTSTSSTNQLNTDLQRQLESLMRKYNISSTSTTSSVNASA